MKRGFLRPDGEWIALADDCPSHNEYLNSIGITPEIAFNKFKWIRVRQGAFIYHESNKEAINIIEQHLEKWGNHSDWNDNVYLIEFNDLGKMKYKRASFEQFKANTNKLIILDEER